MSRVHANNFITTITGSISNSALSLVLASNTGFPTIGAGIVTYLTLQNGSAIEIVEATAITGSTVTIVRAQEGTTAQAFPNGSTASIRPTKGSFDGKADVDSPTFTGTVVLPSTTSIGTVSSTEISYVDGVTSAIQTQIDSKQALLSGAALTAVTVASDDKILIQDTSNSNNLKTVTAQSIADLGGGSSTTTKITVGGNATATGYIELLEDTDNGSSKLTITGQQAMASDKTATFQDVTGTVYVSSGTDVAVADGGTGVSSVTTTPTATAFAGWDANSNLSANNILLGYTSTATAAATTTLTVASTFQQTFTGSTTQTVVLPVVSTLALGTEFKITNLSSNVVTVQSSGANTIQAMAANTVLSVVSNATTGTGASVWSVGRYVPAASDITGSGNLVRATSPTLVTPLLGTPTSGNLTNCTNIPVANATGLLAIANGGTGVSSSKPLIQTVFTTTGTFASGTTIMPFDNTIPQNTEGDEYMTLSITPTNSSNILEIEVVALVTVSTAEAVSGALFQDSTANALKSACAYPGGTSWEAQIIIKHRMTAGTTSSTTFKFRAGKVATGTVNFNGYAGASLFNGTAASYIKITEWTV